MLTYRLYSHDGISDKTNGDIEDRKRKYINMLAHELITHEEYRDNVET